MEIIKLDLDCSFIVIVATQYYLQEVVSRTLICVRIKYTVVWYGLCITSVWTDCGSAEQVRKENNK